MAKQHPLTRRRLRREVSMNSSGRLVNSTSIPVIREHDYYVTDEDLDGDAPKKLIKIYRYQQDGKVRRRLLRTWIPYISKSAEKWYPHESVVEYFINRAGQVLGLNMNEVELVRINGQIRFLSKFFLSKGETLIHGAEICGDYLGDREFVAQIANDKNEARELLTFSFVREAMHSVFPNEAKDLMNDLVRVLIYDALLGNNDRHFYNWAVIRPVRKNGAPPRLAPVYDSARGMFWNHAEPAIVRWLGLLRNPDWKKYRGYLDGAAPRFSLENNKEVNHFDLIEDLCQRENRYLTHAVDLSSVANQTAVVALLYSEFDRLFSPERLQLMARLIEDRFSQIRFITQKVSNLV